MNEDLKEWRARYLAHIDKLQGAIEELKLDRTEFLLYECLLSGRIEEAQSIDAYEVFLRAYQNFCYHLQELESTFSCVQELFEKILSNND